MELAVPAPHPRASRLDGRGRCARHGVSPCRLGQLVTRVEAPQSRAINVLSVAFAAGNTHKYLDLIVRMGDTGIIPDGSAQKVPRSK